MYSHELLRHTASVNQRVVNSLGSFIISTLLQIIRLCSEWISLIENDDWMNQSIQTPVCKVEVNSSGGNITRWYGFSVSPYQERPEGALISPFVFISHSILSLYPVFYCPFKWLNTSLNRQHDNLNRYTYIAHQQQNSSLWKFIYHIELLSVNPSLPWLCSLFLVIQITHAVQYHDDRSYVNTCLFVSSDLGIKKTHDRMYCITLTVSLLFALFLYNWQM